MVFYGVLNMILTKRNCFDGLLQQSKHDFDKDKISSSDFYGDLNIILRKIKLLQRSFAWFKT